MNHKAIQSNRTITSISVSTKLTLAKAKEIVFTTHDFYLALKNDQPLPEKTLPELSLLLKANKIMKLYMQHSNFGLNIKLFNACLTEAQLVTVWQLVTGKTQQLAIGNNQVFIVKNQ